MQSAPLIGTPSSGDRCLCEQDTCIFLCISKQASLMNNILPNHRLWDWLQSLEYYSTPLLNTLFSLVNHDIQRSDEMETVKSIFIALFTISWCYCLSFLRFINVLVLFSRLVLGYNSLHFGKISNRFAIGYVYSIAKMIPWKWLKHCIMHARPEVGDVNF